jgi:hypothetical protein
MVGATDRRQLETPIIYEISSGNEDGIFNLDPGTGLLSLLTPLDFEARQTHGLTVMALGVSGQSASATVLVFVSDVNDNSPIFSQLSYSGAIMENAAPVTSILQVSATDRDSSLGGVVTYSLSSSSDDFMINSSTGELFSIRALDFEAVQSLTLTVMASDSGEPPLAATVHVTVQVLDENDVRPSFPSDALSAEISELRGVGSDVIQVQAVDPDTSNLTYLLIGGNEDGNFDIDGATGLVTLRSPLDFEATDLYSLVVSVSDGVSVLAPATVTISVRVLDGNDNAPQFIGTPYTSTLPEDVPPGSTVLTVSASDSDTGDNAAVIYSISSVDPSEPVFTVDALSGVISTTSSLDFERQRAYQVLVMALDRGTPAQSSSTLVLISVEDTNDNAPRFDESSVTVTHPEDLPSGSQIAILTAVDADSGNNSRIQYTLQQPNAAPFEIDTFSGAVSLQGSLDYETEVEYLLEVVAEDLGMPSLSSTATLTVIVQDRNDNLPIFTQDRYSAAILETQVPGSVVVEVLASDADSGTNAAISYSITAGNLNSVFAINITSGVIVLANSVDFERISLYNLSVTAVNFLATDQLVATVTVSVQVLEVNEFPPTFSMNVFEVNILENLPSGQSLVGVAATDLDGGAGGRLSYQITSGNDRMSFELLPDGTLSTLISLDREQQELYNLTVTVSDGGTPSLTASASIVVTVLDTNDSPPTFLLSSYAASVQENAVLGTNLIVTPPIRAADEDEQETANSRITFSIASGDPGQVFGINSQTGLVQVVGSVDFEQTTRFELVLEAADSGVPPLSSSALLAVEVLDANDNSPRISNTPTQLVFTEGAGRLLLLPTVAVSDADSLPLSQARVSLTAVGPLSEGQLGVLSLGAAPSGIAVSITEDGQTIQLTGLFSPQALTTLLRTLAYSNQDAEPDPTPRTLTLLVSDGNFQASFQLSLLLQLLNDNAPELDLDTSTPGRDFTTLFQEEGEPVGIAGAVTVRDQDRDADGIVNVTVSLTNARDSAEGLVLVSPPLPQFMVEYLDDNITLVVTSSPPASFEEIQSLIQSIFYQNPADEPLTPLDRVVQVTISDGLLSSAPAFSTVSIILSDDPPVISLSSNTDIFVNFVEGGGFVLLSSGLSLADADSPELVNATVSLETAPDGVSESLSLGVPTHQALTITATAHSIHIQGPASPADFSAVLGSVRYDNILRSPSSQVRRAVFTVSDGTSVTQATAFISFDLVNDQPVLDLNGAPPGSDVSQTFLEGSVAIQVTSQSLMVTDVDSPLLDYALVQLTSSPDGASEGLSSATMISPELTVTASPTSIEVRGPASSDAFTAVLSTLRYFNNAEEPTAGERVILFLVSDGELNSTVVSSTVIVQLVNDVPLLLLNDGLVYDTMYVEEGPSIPLVNPVGGIVLTDNDNTTLSHLSVSIQNLFDGNTEILGFADPSDDQSLNVQSVPGMEANTHSFQFSAGSSTLENFASVVSSLTYRSTSLEPTAGIREVSISVSDGLSSSISQLSRVNVTLLNDNPPVFQRFAYQGRVSENAVDVIVTTVSASDADSSDGLFAEHGTVQYQILSGNEEGTFQIDPNTGAISVLVARDRESGTVNPVLIVSASNPVPVTTPTAPPTAIVIITIADVNDNTPQFLDGPYMYQVTEHAQIGTFVGVVTASDDDAGSNSEVEYSIGQGTLSLAFSIDRDSGEISVANSTLLDRERSHAVTLSITATDGGNPQTSNTSLVTIQLLDVNDNAPVFSTVSYAQAIPESLGLNMSVLTVLAMDADATSNGDVSYTLNGTISFSVDSVSGLVTTLAPLDREGLADHRFTVIATDAGLPSLSATAQVVISLLDENDNGPVFQRTSYSAAVLESLPVGQQVGDGVVATDLDSGSNAMIRYSIMDPVPFSVDAETGVVTISAPLDREEQGLYNFTVVASDRGSPAQTTSAVFTVTILDVNDNRPMFPQASYSARIDENATIFTPVATIEAVDGDEGRNADVTYSLADGRGTFQIDSITGQVFTVGSVDFEQQSSYVLDIQASDGGVVPLSSTTTLTISITDENDNAPVFGTGEYRFTVTENLAGGVIGSVFAQDADSGSNADITYSIADSELDGTVFRLDAGSGDVSTAFPLDRELQDSYSFTVVALDSGTPPLSSQATVRVVVEDSNDNPPVFSQEVYSTTQGEDVTVGSPLLAVNATDEDIGINGDVTFRLALSGAGLFSLNEISGQLTLAGSLDAESALSHTLQVVASDSGTPELSATATILVLLTDINDEPIHITTLSAPVEYTEDDPPSAIAPDISVSDGDVSGSVLNATVELLAVRGCCHALLLLDSVTSQFPDVFTELVDGVLMLYGPTSPANMSQLLSSVLYSNTNPEPLSGSLVARFTASDGVFSDAVDVRVTISTINDNAPVVALDEPSANYTTIFTENSLGIGAVGVVNISDADSGEQSLLSVTVTLLNGVDGALEALTANSVGLVSVFPQQGHTLVLSGPAPVEDFVSSLSSLRYMNSADDPQPPLQRVVEVIASDGLLLSDPQYSTIDVIATNDPPSLTLSSLRDYNTTFTEHGPAVRLSDSNLQLSDPDSPQLQLALVNISNILDAGSEFLLVSAQDSITRLSDTEISVIGPASLSAVISALRSVTYLNNATSPSPGVREVTIIVSDGELLSSASAFVRVDVVNDPPSLDLNGPSLPGLNFTVSFTEGGSAVNISSGDAFITDSDNTTLISLSVGIAGPLDGSAETLSVPSLPQGITSTLGGGRLELMGEATIDTYTALVRSVQYNNTAAEPSGGSRLLEVVCSDGRLLSQLVSSLVEFTLVNDPPQVVLDQGGDFSTVYLENSLPVSIVNPRSASVMDVDSPTLSHMILEASNLLDGDVEGLNFTASAEGLLVVTMQSEQGRVLTYNLSYPQPMAVAVFHQLLLSTQYFNTAEEPNATLPRLVRVMVSDGELTSQTLTSTITIRLIDDNEPRFTAPLYMFDVSEGVSPGTELGVVVATDADIGDDFLYQVATGDIPFSVDSVTGAVSVSGSVDRERQDQYALTLRLSRTTPPFSVFDDQALVVISVLDVNDNTPSFNQTMFSLEASEDLIPGTTIATLDATDADDNNNAMLNYSLDGTSPFELDALTGELSVSESLDRELTSSYRFTVRVMDAGSPALSSTAVVMVEVLDVNDVVPQFQQPFYSAELVENALVGTSLVQLSARDGDVGSNALLSYTLTPAGPLFTVNASTGLISTSNILPPGFYNLTAIVSDAGTPLLSSTVPVSITVNTFNSTLPVFTLPLYTASVLENSPPEVSVVTVEATDPLVTGGGVSYTVTGTDVFAINSSSGLIITTATSLDREVRDTYQLQVTATSSDGERMGVASVIITVQDANDFPPIFTQSSYSFNIAENNNVGEVLGGVLAVDSQDVGANAEVVLYQLSNSNFSVDTSAGIVSAAVQFDREMQDVYTFLVMAVDGGTPPLSSSSSIVVFILDTNDRSPLFSQLSYQGNVAENQPVGTPVLVVQATDDDLGQNAALTYSINSTVFAVDSQTGLLSTLTMLDFEGGPVQYNVSVQATDNGLPEPLSSTVMVIITVLDVDDTPPAFSMATYFTSAQEGQLHTSILQVIATDADSPPGNTISYAISGGNSDGDFAVSQAGVLSVVRPLDRETLSQFSLTIVASNLAATGVPLSSTATVNVEVLDVNDNSPSFLGLPYRFSVSEGAASGLLLGTLSATDEDSSSNANIGGFDITEGNSDGLFSVDPQSGILRLLTNDTLDRETTDRYDLVIVVSDSGSPPLFSETNVTITILDVNDEVPMFRQLSYTADVRETTPIGTTIFSANEEATDNDLGTNADLSFSLQDQNPDFTLSTDGELTVANTLDFESEQSYSLVLQAVDGGSPSLTGSAVLNIIILDQDDQPVQFVPDNFVAGTFENSIPGTVVLTTTARDPDTVQGNPITYSIEQLPQAAALPFSIDSQSGVITVSGPLDRETVALYSFTVLATNTPGFNASATVTIDILDVNDITPHFPVDMQFQLSEALPAGFIIAEISAVDGDQGSNGEILMYSLEGAPSMFEIDSDNGTLTLLGVLDFEDAESYMFNVTAVDGGIPPLTGRAQVQVNVTDVNDNTPQFSSDSYQVTVSENAPAGSAILTALAQDADSAANGQISFSLAQPSAEFSIDSTTGVVMSVSRLFIRNYTVFLSATDAGNPPLSSIATLLVVVTDANESPVFSQPSYSVTIPEDRVVSSLVIQVAATDTDLGVNSDISYGINPQELFSIDEDTGRVTVSRSLDFELQQIYTLLVYASDNGIPPLNTSAQLTVQLTDTNDNAPSFSEASYSVRVPENTAVGSTVVRVTATDADSTSNAAITYSISQDSSLGSVAIDPMRGDIFLINTLDYESSQTVQLMVQARDGGSTFLFTSVPVTLSISDVDDNSPVFSEDAIYLASVEEQLRTGSMVTTVMATDEDEGQNAAIQYTLINSTNLPFAVNLLSGEVFIASPGLDREDVSQFMLVVEATNPFSSTFTATALVLVTVLDSNDNLPQFDPRSLQATTSELSPVGTVLGSVLATDADIGNNSVITFSFDPPSLLVSVNPQSGVVQVNAALDFETTPTLDLTVVATDSGDLPLSSAANYRLTILNANDEPPVLSSTRDRFSFREGSAPVGIGGDLSLSDPDSLPLVNASAKLFLSRVGVPPPANDFIQVESGVFGLTVSASTSCVNITGSGTVQAYLSLLSRLQFGSTAEEPVTAPRLVLVEVFDEDFTSGPLLLTLDIQSINDNSPVLDLSLGEEGLDYQTTFTEGGIFVLTSPDASLSDLDGDDIQSVQINLTNAIDPEEGLDLFVLNIGSITVVRRNDGLDLIGPASAADFELALQTVYYENSADEPSDPQQARVVSFVASDGSRESTPALAVVTILLVNDRPAIRLRGTVSQDSVLIYAETLPSLPLVTEALAISDVDSELLLFVNVTIDSFQSAVDQLQYSTAGYNISAEFLFGTLLLTGPATASDFVAVMQTLQYVNSLLFTDQLDSLQGGKSVQFSVSDGALVSELATAFITFEGVNDPPIVDLNGPAAGRDFAAVFTEGDAEVNLTSPLLSIRDVDSTELASVSAILSGVLDSGNEELDVIFQIPEVMELYNFSAYHLTLQGRSLSSNYELLLRSLVYRNTNPDPTPGTRVVTIAASDGEDISDSVRVTIAVSALNDPPELTLTPLGIPFVEESGGVALFTGVQIADPDNRTLASVSVQLENVVDVESEFLFVPDSVDGLFLSESQQDGGVRQLVFSFIPNSLGTAQAFTSLLQQLHYNNTALEPAAGTRRVNVSVSDGVLSSETISVLIRVDLVNDNVPMFSDQAEFVMLPEDAALQASIFQAMASDDDVDSILSYSIEPQVLFTISATSGVVRLTGSIDREVVDSYDLTITATDGVHSDTMLLRVEITDVNDNPPQFAMSTYTVAVEENVLIGTPILLLVANDTDSGSNADITFSIGDGNAQRVFAIDTTSGELSISAAIDFELVQSYRISIIAADAGVPQQTSRAFVLVGVLDLNDNPPVFTPDQDTVSFAEDLALLTVVYTAQAVDADAGALLVYSLDNDTSDRFAVNTNSGQVILARELDFESASAHIITVEAFDGIFSSPFTLTLQVSDVDDNDPVFITDMYNVSLSENATISTDILAGEAPLRVVDSDTGPSAAVQFMILSGDPMNQFALNALSSDSAQLTLAGGLDREAVADYMLVLLAVNPTQSSRNATAVVSITVTDENDSPPMFGQPVYTFPVSESVGRGTVLGQVSATDADAGTNGAVEYTILPGDSADIFNITSLGEISLASNSLDFELSSRLSLEVIAVDGGIPPLSAQATVIVAVQDDNDNPPVFTEGEVNVDLTENSPPSTTVAILRADDADAGANGEVQYSIHPDNATRFRVDRQSGVLTTTGPPLDYESDPEELLVIIRARDSGTPSLSSTAQVRITLLDINEFLPVFSIDSTLFEVSESIMPQTVVLVLNATDGDRGSAGVVAYTLVGVRPPTSAFVIDNITGEVSTTRDASLDRESVDTYMLTVQASNPLAAPLLSTLISVTLNLLDENDNPPTFNQESYRVAVTTNINVGDAILTVSASDVDAAANGDIRYSIIRSSTDDSMSDAVGQFNISQSTGVIVLAAALSGTGSFQLTILATDQGNPSQSSSVTVTISIIQPLQIDFSQRGAGFLLDQPSPTTHNFGLFVDSPPGSPGTVSATLGNVTISTPYTTSLPDADSVRGVVLSEEVWSDNPEVSVVVQVADELGDVHCSQTQVVITILPDDQLRALANINPQVSEFY